MNKPVFLDDINKCLEVLNAGGVILYPTDTVWGLGCDATNKEAVKKIYNIKKRNDEKALVVLVAEEQQVLKYVAAPDMSVFDYLQSCKKPTSVIYENGIGFAENLMAGDGSIAIRICKDAFCRYLLKRFRKPIVSTSVNISGMPAPKFFSEILDDIKSKVDHIVNYRQDDNTVAEPSSIIKWEKGKAIIIRE